MNKSYSFLFLIFFLLVESKEIVEIHPNHHVFINNNFGFVEASKSLICLTSSSSLFGDCFPINSIIRCRSHVIDHWECFSLTFWSNIMEPPKIVVIDWIKVLNITCFPELNRPPYQCRLVYEEKKDSQNLITIREEDHRATRLYLLVLITLTFCFFMSCFVCYVQFSAFSPSLGWLKQRFFPQNQYISQI